VAGYDEVNEQVIVFGGRTVNEDGDTDTIYGDTWVFDMRNMTWRLLELVDSPPPTFAGVAGVVQVQCELLIGNFCQTTNDYEGYFVLASGELGDDERTSYVWVLSLYDASRSAGARDNDITWHRLPTYGEIPKPSVYLFFFFSRVEGYGASGGVHGTHFYLSHGFNYVRFADTYRLDLTALSTFFF
jgi:hypothetical protein